MSGPVLPEELLEEILTRVPVKDLMRFKCVSKWLRSLVFDPTFVKMHLQRSSKNTHTPLTFDEGDDEWDGWSYCVAPCSIHGLLKNPISTLDNCHHPFKFDDTVSILGVCNGLVCLSHHNSKFNEYWFQFWNPATRMVSKDSPSIRVRSSSGYMFGLGYDDWSDNYQVVLLADNDIDKSEKKMEVRVHSLGDTCWRNTLTCHSFRTLSVDGASVSCTVNWLALPNLKSSYEWESGIMDKLVILSYDLKKETCSYLSMPNALSENPRDVLILKALKGCLCLSHHDRRNHFVVWLMREFGVENSWTLLLKISNEQFHIPDYIVSPFSVVMCTSKNDDIMLLANYNSAEFILYNKRNNRIEWCDHFFFKDGKGGEGEGDEGDEGEGDEESFNYGCFLSYDYVQSLVLPY